MKRFFAFTLAETLIVMGIIGIVSALTLPNLNSSTGEKEKVAKVKKIYQNLNDAYGRAVAIYGPIDEWFVNDTTDDTQRKRAFERITEFMKISKSNATNYTVVLADGTFLNFGSAQYLHLGNSKYYDAIISGSIYIDIDGEQKGENEIGKDMFVFDILNIGIMPHGQDTSKGKSPCATDAKNYCTAWVIEHENMDYLKCYDKLKWGEQTTCK